MNLSTKNYLLSIFFVLITVTSAHSSDFQSARTIALGGAGHAGPLLNDPIYLNPAFTSFLKSYSLAFNFLKYTGEDPYKGRNYNLSLLDGRSDLFQAGLGMTTREEGTLINIGAAKAAVERLGFGLGGKFFFSTGHESARDMIFSVAGIPLEQLQLGFIIDNLIESDAIRAQGFYREFILASKFNIMNIVLIYLDPHIAPTYGDNKSFGHELGAEFAFMQDLYFRLGQFRNASQPHQRGTRASGWTLGGGWVGPRFSMDYAFQKITVPAQDREKISTHTLGFTLYL